MIRTYSELITLPTFKERFEYLKLNGRVGEDTFGYERYLNQSFYRSKKWRSIRARIIVRDDGLDLGVKGYSIYGRLIVHHMNPLTVEDIENESPYLADPEYLILVSHDTHNAITFGDEKLLPTKDYIERFPGDTKLW